jgi:hypothetical protein
VSENAVPAAAPLAGPAAALVEIADELRAEATVISRHVVEPSDSPALGLLVAQGPRCRRSANAYAGVVERVREGYLLHYATPRLIAGADRDLALLAGDHLYALGLERLARLGDLEAVRELADLISLCAQLHSDSGNAELAGQLWLATVVAIAAGPSDPYVAAKSAARAGSGEAAGALRGAALEIAANARLEAPLAEAADAIESAADRGAS